jgi:hypothetical protein
LQSKKEIPDNVQQEIRKAYESAKAVYIYAMAVRRGSQHRAGRDGPSSRAITAEHASPGEAG